MRNNVHGDHGREQLTEAAARWRGAGYEVFSPYEAHERFGPYDLRAECMAFDLPHLCRSDEMVCSKGWQNSRCCRVEVELAEALEIDIWIDTEGNEVAA